MWATGKLAAVREWADDHGIDLEESYAYSDSVFDSPLLAAVGHPVAVNPDPRMVVMATLRRWPILNLDVPPGVFKVPVLGIELQKIAMPVHASPDRPALMPYVRFDIDGLEQHPEGGRGDRRRQPPQLLRRGGDGDDDRPHRPRRRASSARRRCSTLP